MQNCQIPIPIDKKTRKLSKYTATIYQDETLAKLIEIFGKDVVDKYWPEDLRAKPELLKVLSLWRRKKIYIDGSPITHKSEYGSTYANDFLVPIWTPVTPILEWKICYIQNGITDYGMDFKYASKCNMICIDHGLNTFSEYMHTDSSYKIQMDMKVTPDDIIWSVCASGMEDLPHVHVNYFEYLDNKKQSLPMNLGSLRTDGEYLPDIKDLWKM